jgi:hypothetical protein
MDENGAKYRFGLFYECKYEANRSNGTIDSQRGRSRVIEEALR